MMLETATIEQIRKKLGAVKKVAILTHSNPDGDAIGSSLGLALALNKQGFEARVIIPDGLPDFLRWLPGIELALTYAYKKEQATEIVEQAELLFCLDFNEENRVGNMASLLEASKAYKVLIDHHQHPAHFCDLQFSEDWRGSVGEMIYHFITEVFPEGTLDKDMATCLYTAIMTDTGNFSFASSYPEVFEAVAELLRTGIEKDKIFSSVYDSFSESRMRLQGYCMSEKLNYFPQYRAAYISLTDEELKRFGHRKGDTEGFVNIPFSIKGIRFTALFVEKADRIKVSLRSRGSFPANLVASEHFHGGGHRNAAGGDSFTTMEETLARFEALLPSYQKQLTDEED